MTNRTMSAKQARDNFTDLLGAVYYGKEPIIVEKKGRPFAVVINPDEYARYQQIAKDQFFQAAAKIRSSNTKFNEAEILKDITQVVEEVRASRDGNQR